MHTCTHAHEHAERRVCVWGRTREHSHNTTERKHLCSHTITQPYKHRRETFGGSLLRGTYTARLDGQEPLLPRLADV